MRASGDASLPPSVLVDNLAAINAMKASFNLAPEQLNVVQTADVEAAALSFSTPAANAIPGVTQARIASFTAIHASTEGSNAWLFR